jgi:hypothetical protein
LATKIVALVIRIPKHFAVRSTTKLSKSIGAGKPAPT